MHALLPHKKQAAWLAAIPASLGLAKEFRMTKTCSVCFHSAAVTNLPHAECPKCGRVYAKVAKTWR